MNFLVNKLIHGIFFIILYILSNTPLKAANLFHEASYKPLISDHKARMPGDLLTVIVLETANAQTSSALSSGKELKTTLEASYNNNHQEAALGMQGKGNSAAKTDRNGKIKASLTVTIKKIFPNSNYFVEGAQKITINGENQKILLSGVVRPEDISAQNTLLSTRLANAHISYAGNGSVSNAQKHHYAYKILSFIGLI